MKNNWDVMAYATYQNGSRCHLFILKKEERLTNVGKRLKCRKEKKDGIRDMNMIQILNSIIKVNNFLI